MPCQHGSAERGGAKIGGNMKKRIMACSAGVMLACAIPVSAAPPVTQPVQVGAETVRFDRGLPTVTLKKQKGAVQLRPRAIDHGSIAFDIAIYNNSEIPQNFDVANVEAAVGVTKLRPFTLVELEKKAKNRAMWTQIGVAVLAGAAAASAASMQDTYTSTLYTPYGGVYRGYYTRPSAAGQVLAAGAIVGGVATSMSIEEQLQRTLEGMQNNVIQITTINPGDSYAGMIVLEKAKKAALPQRFDIVVHWNGEDYPFALQLAKAGTPMPVFNAITPVDEDPSAPIDTLPVAGPAKSTSEASKTAI